MSWSKLAFALGILTCVPVYFYFSGTNDDPPLPDKSKFIEHTQRLIAELSQDSGIISKSSEPVIGQTPTSTFESIHPDKGFTTFQKQEEKYPKPDDPIQSAVSDPVWKNELELYLNGDSTPEKFLESLNIKNWEHARDELAIAYEKNRLPPSKKFQEKFWTKVGEIGGKQVAEKLLTEGDPAFSEILQGWAKGSPQAMFDYYARLDLKSPEVQSYLEKTFSREIPLMDQFSSGIIDGILKSPKGKVSKEQLANANEMIDYFLETNPTKAESMMREFTERVITGRDKETLKQWVSGYQEPELQAGTAQRVIESGVFDKNPLEAVEFANSLESKKAKRSALSSAYARLAGGKNGHDPNHTAAELNAMENSMERDFALNGFAHGLVRKDPEAALEWANSISNENFRKVIVKNITKRINKELINQSTIQK